MIPVAKPLFDEEEEKAVVEVIRSGMLAHGPVTEDFERQFADFVGVKHAVAVSSGTSALHLALEAAGVGPGDDVLVPAFSFVASANVIRLVGANPIFVDIEPTTFTMDVGDIPKAATPKTRAIMPIHLYGMAADMASIQEQAEKHDWALIEDCAQSHGATYHGRQTGSMGTAGGFSFYPTKNVAMGEGGMVTTDDNDYADLIASLRNHGRGHSTLGTYDHVRLGWNLRTTDVLSAIGRVQLGKLAAFTAKRRQVAEWLDEALEDIEGITTPTVPAGRNHVYHQYTIRCQDRDQVQQRLNAAGVGSGIYYPKPMYEYMHLASFARACPEAERAAKEVLSLPVHPSVSRDDVETIAEALQ